jgi:PAS domain S-box-containing protein
MTAEAYQSVPVVPEQEKLRVSEIRYRRLFESARDGILILDALTRKITDVNPFMVQLLGYSRAEFLGKELWDLPASRRADQRRRFSRAAGERVYPLRRLAAADQRGPAARCGSREQRLRREWPPGHSMQHSRHHAASRLADEPRLGQRDSGSHVEHSDDGIISKTLDGIITTWNAGAQRLYGYTAQEMIGRSVSLLVPADMPDEMPHLLEKIRHGETVEHYETVRVRKDGSRIDISLSISPLRDGRGNIIGASSIKRDISERKRAALAEQGIATPSPIHTGRSPLAHCCS